MRFRTENFAVEFIRTCKNSAVQTLNWNQNLFEVLLMIYLLFMMILNKQKQKIFQIKFYVNNQCQRIRLSYL